MRESYYQAALIKRIYARFDGRCFVMKNDAALKQGILDLVVLFEGGYWAMLEVKASRNAPHQPNQDYYVEKFGAMCFAAFIYPENEEAVLNAIEQELQKSCWAARIP